MNFKRFTDIARKIAKIIADEFKSDLKYEDDSELHMELRNRIRQIKEINSQKIIMNQYVPEIIKQTLEKDNCLISPAQALPYAVQKFNDGIASGEIDSLLFDFVDTEEIRKGNNEN